MKSKLVILAGLMIVGSSFAADYQVALPGYRYQFPRDYFNHPEYQTEWWYYTGNLTSADGHRFGFELTFFRQGISRKPDSSTWYVHDLYMAHLALSDISGDHFYHSERINRAGPGIAGIDQAGGLIWNGNWQVHLQDGDQQLRGGTEAVGLDLDMRPAKPVVIQGQEGVSQKAEGAGHASHYLSFTRLLTSGSIEVKGRSYRVQGTSWMDHEFFTGSMASDESGWDWVGLQFNDNTELMLYRMRHRDGSVDPYSSGSYVAADGTSTFLSAKDFVMTPAGSDWTSPVTKGRYPLRWNLLIPRLGIRMDISTPLQDQELSGGVGPSYWEGAVEVTGQHANKPVQGFGYLEMTGYGGVDPIASMR